MTRRAIDVEALLAWAYRDELPKAERTQGLRAVSGALGYGDGWGSVSRQGETMAWCVSDGRPNAYGVSPLGGGDGSPPHPDALAAHAAVAGLRGLHVEIPEGWSPLAGLGLSGGEQREAIARAAPRVFRTGADGARTLAFDLCELARRYAILGGSPPWDAETPRRSYVEVRGRPAWFRLARFRDVMSGGWRDVEVDGFDPRAQKPYADAYRKIVLSPDPAEAVVDRAIYEAWIAALDLIAGDLRESGALIAHDVSDRKRPSRPWEN